MINLEGIKNIIFDLGGVIINIDYHRTLEAFIQLGVNDFKNIYTQFNQYALFDELDTGNISGNRFISELQKLLPQGITDQEIRDAWNAMLLDFPEDRAGLLKSLKQKYRIFILSNTNEIHLEYYFKKLQEEHGISDFHLFCEKEYYSHLVHLRKPDPGIFKYVLKDNGLLPEETLFIDDSPQHVGGAARTGIRAYHLQPPETIIDLFREVQ